MDFVNGKHPRFDLERVIIALRFSPLLLNLKLHLKNCIQIILKTTM